MRAPRSDRAAWPDLPGEMAAHVRAHDWPATPLGPSEDWPERVKAVVELVLASTQVATLALGDDRRLIYNDAAARLYGGRHPGALGRPLAEAFADSYPAVAPFYDRVFAGETVEVTAQPLAVGGDAGDEVFDAYLTPVRDAGGAVAGAHMTGFEIGDRLRTEAALRASEERYRAFVTASADAVYRMSADWRQVQQLEGRGFVAETRVPDDAWMDRYVPAEDQAMVRAAIAAAIGDRATFDLTHRMIRADGTPGWTRSRAIPIFDADGAVLEWLGTASDVTEQRDAAEALKRSETIRRVAIAGGRMGTWRWDLKHRQVSGDAQFMALWGFSPSDDPLPLASFTDRMSPEGVAQTEEVVTRAIAAGEEFDSALQVATGPTAGNWVRWRGRPADDDTSVLYGVTFDITEQQATDKRLRELQDRQSFLLTLGDALRSLDSPAELQATATRLLAQHLGVTRAVYTELRVEDGREYVAVQADYREPGAASIAGRFPTDTFASDLELHRAGLPVAVADTERELSSEAERDAWRGLGARAYLGAPFVKGGRLLATFGVHHAQPRIWTSEEIALVQEAAERVWGAVERARAEAALHESEERQAFLLKLSDMLRPIVDPVEIQTVATRLLGEHLGASRVFYATVERDDDTATIAGSYADGVPSRIGRCSLSAFSPRYLEEWRAGRAAGTSDVDADPKFDAAGRAAYAALSTRAGFGVPLIKDGRLAAVLGVNQSTPRDWTDQEMDLSSEVADRTWAAVARGRAEVALRDSESNLRTLVAELQHRVRNMLTVVRLTFARTFELGGDAEEMADHFKGRLDALARTQVLVTQTARRTADLEDIVREELLSIGVRDGPNIVIEGPEVQLDHKIAEALGMALHELTTNALKYGAFRVEGGKLEVRWTVDPDQEGRPQLALSWRERGVPAITVRPTREGFGRELIEEALPYRLGAETRLEFNGGGVCCSIRMPLAPGKERVVAQTTGRS